jgi:hypothetical protein
MKGGTISGNTAESVHWSEGGGVSVKGNCTFTMQGGTISGNTTNGGANGGNGSGSGGGGVSVYKGTFTMEGGAISGNTAQQHGDWSGGGGVKVGRDSTFTLKVGTIYGKSADPSLANSATYDSALNVGGDAVAAKWGTGGVYKKGGVLQSGTGIGSTDDTLEATP